MFCFKCGADIKEGDRVCPSCGAPIGAAIEQRASEEAQPTRSGEVTFGARAIAFGLDLIVLLFCWFGLRMLLWGYAIYLMPVVFGAYFTLSVGGSKASTFGMRTQGLRAKTHKTGEKPDYTRALIRSLILIVSVGAAGLGCLLYFITGGRMLHDIVSGTDVVSAAEE